jgi:predicted ester cyclase
MKISTSLVCAIGLVAFAGCSKKKEEGVAKTTEPTTVKPAEPPKPEPPKPMTGAELAEHYKKCTGFINEGKFDDFKKDCVDEGFTGHPLGVGQEMKGPDAIIGMMKGMKTAFPDMKHEPQVVLVNGRNVLSVNLITGTHQGPLKTPMGEVPATNKKMGVLLFQRLSFNDANKVIDGWGMSDTATQMGQLGIAPKGAMPTRPAMEKGMEGAPIVVVAADDAKEKANLETYKKAVDAYNAHKLADMTAIMTDDAVLSVQSLDKDAKGKKEIEKQEKAFMDAFSDAKVSGNTMWAAGDYVVDIGKFEGTNDKDFGKIKKTGKKVSLDYIQIAQFKDGKAAQLWRFSSGMQFMMQLGMMPAPGAAPAAGEAPKAGEPEKK